MNDPSQMRVRSNLWPVPSKQLPRRTCISGVALRGTPMFSRGGLCPPRCFELFHLLSHESHDSVAPRAQAHTREPGPTGNPVNRRPRAPPPLRQLPWRHVGRLRLASFRSGHGHTPPRSHRTGCPAAASSTRSASCAERTRIRRRRRFALPSSCSLSKTADGSSSSPTRTRRGSTSPVPGSSCCETADSRTVVPHFAIRAAHVRRSISRSPSASTARRGFGARHAQHAGLASSLRENDLRASAGVGGSCDCGLNHAHNPEACRNLRSGVLRDEYWCGTIVAREITWPCIGRSTWAG